MRPPEISRTAALAQVFLEEYCTRNQVKIFELALSTQNIAPLNPHTLARREALLAANALEDSMFALAHQFAAADRIVIAAPYWDLSFPAALKAYIEQLCVSGITFCYTPQGIHPLCRADKLLYISTCGGYLDDVDFGAVYVRGLATKFFGIADFSALRAEGLDIDGNDVPALLDAARQQARTLAATW